MRWVAVAVVAGVVLGLGGQIRTVAAGASPLKVLQVVPLNSYDLSLPSPVLEVDCAINQVPTWCIIDTGDEEGITLPPRLAATVRAPLGGPEQVASVGSVVNEYTTSVSLTVGGQTVVASGSVATTWGGWPLIGLPALEGLAPGGMRVDWTRQTVTFLG